MTSSPPPSPTPVGLQIGKFRISRAAAQTLLFVLFALITWAVWAAKPSWAMLVSGGIWVAFLVYWSRQARAPTPTVKVEPRRSSLKHVAWREIGLLLLFLPVPLLNGVVLPNGHLHPFVGLGVQLLGAWFYLYAKGYLGRQWSGSISIKTDHQLITSGPYRRIRHPMYTGMITMALGTAIVSTRLHALVGAMLVAVSYVIKIGIEEVWLGEHFGGAYEEWRHHSWKLIPPIY
jgi:protein-S-isoprenylcysteine O-methyltransferase Ste14